MSFLNALGFAQVAIQRWVRYSAETFSRFDLEKDLTK